ncbi:hypothetical protein ACF0H5_003367 [Mactra antiquata]
MNDLEIIGLMRMKDLEIIGYVRIKNREIIGYVRMKDHEITGYVRMKNREIIGYCEYDTRLFDRHNNRMNTVRVKDVLYTYMCILTILPGYSVCDVINHNEDVANRFWKKYFCSEWSNLPWKQDSNRFKSTRIVQNRTLIGDCVADIGTCPLGSCSKNNVINFFNCPKDGAFCPRTETRTINCGIYGLRKYQYVTGCDCCQTAGIRINTMVTDSITHSPLRDIKINLRGKVLGKTDTDGKFTFNTHFKQNRVLILEAVDGSSTHMNVINRLTVPEEFTGTFNVNMKLIKKPTPVQLNTNGLNRLSLSKNTADLTDINSILVNANTFTDVSGMPYKGAINASISFVDPTIDPKETIPGVFLTQVGDVTENLISDGMFAAEFKDENGEDLVAGPMKVTVREGMKLWTLDKQTGLWKPAKVLHRRRRRQVGVREEITVNVTNREWINIDKIAQAPKCFFKARIFAEDTGAEIKTSQTTLYKPEIIGVTRQNQHFRLYADYTRRPHDTCYEVRCPSIKDRFEAHSGFINMSSLQKISVSGQEISFITYLKPFDISLYDLTRPLLERIHYTVYKNKIDIFTNFTSSKNGPYYEDKTVCEQSTLDSPSFNFFEPAPPKYEQEPTVHDICTARISFTDHWNFYNYTAGLDKLPLIKAISSWSKLGQDMFYSDLAIIKDFTFGQDYVLFACVKYRCSHPNDPTIVYLDINVSNVTDSYETVHSGGYRENITFSVPAFHCEGECVGSMCKNKGIDVQGTSIDGSFTADIKHEYMPKSHACENSVNLNIKTDFTFFCHSREGFPQ